MEVIEFTNDNVFNTMFTMFVYIASVLVPLFGAIALSRN